LDAAFYKKWIRDWRDVQDIKTGMVPHSAPQRVGGGGPAWGGILQAITWRHYLYYGDIRVLEDNYDACRHYANAFERYCRKGILRFYGGQWTSSVIGLLPIAVWTQKTGRLPLR